MTIPVHPTSETGSLGEDMAAVIFQQIRWAPPVKVRQDIGTDLVTFARDTAAPEKQSEAYDLGAPVFMQVKGSRAEYSATEQRKVHGAHLALQLTGPRACSAAGAQSACQGFICEAVIVEALRTDQTDTARVRVVRGRSGVRTAAESLRKTGSYLMHARRRSRCAP